MKTNLFHLCTLTLATHALPLMMYSCNIIVHHVPKSINCHKAIVVITRRASCFHHYRYIYIYIYIYITYICIYLYLIYSVYKFTKNCHSDTTPPSDQRDSQGQGLFLAPSAEKQTCNYDRVLKPLSIPITIKHQNWAAACSRIHICLCDKIC